MQDIECRCLCRISLQLGYENENIWLTQKMMAVLYDVSVPAVNQHIKRIFDDGELSEYAVVKKYLITADDGKKLCHDALQSANDQP